MRNFLLNEHDQARLVADIRARHEGISVRTPFDHDVGDAADSTFWWYIAITYVPFLISNGVLTAVPVVTYRPEAVTGLRVGSIPVEDFLYSFTMLTLEWAAYITARRLIGTL